MTESPSIDQIDRRILTVLQADATLSQRALAEQVGLSQNACWRRLRRLQEAGITRGSRVVLDRTLLGLDLVVFMMVRTRHHSAEWSERFCRHVAGIPEVSELHRIGGDWDYLLRVVTNGMAGYDRVYRELIGAFDLETVTGYFSMEAMLEDRPLRPPGV